jgi:GTPase SAR1 family protein
VKRIPLSDAMFKVCIFGDGGVGKTTLIGRYLTGVFSSNSEITIGVDFHIKKIEMHSL